MPSSAWDPGLHDRAVFHFLTTSQARRQYLQNSL